jgi:hypothetical protein
VRPVPRTLRWAFVCWCALLGALAAPDVYQRSLERFRQADREADALACARASERTDAAIADCYLDRGLPVPADL